MPPQQKKITTQTTVDKNSHSVERTNPSKGSKLTVTSDPHHSHRGIVTTARELQNNELPSNRDIKRGIQDTKHALDSKVHSSNLNQHGQVLKDDTKNLLTATETMIDNKNKDEVVQGLIKESLGGFQQGVETQREKSKLHQKGYKREKIATKKEHAKAKGRESFYFMRKLALLIVRSGQFRGLLLDLTHLFQDYLKQDMNAYGEGTALSNQDNSRVLGQDFRSSFSQRFSSILYELSSSKEYKQAVYHLFSLSDRIWERLSRDNSKRSSSQLKDDKHWEDMRRDAYVILGRFAGEKETQSAFNETHQLYSEMRNDSEARAFFRELRRLITDVLENPELLNGQTFNERSNQIMQDGRWMMKSQRQKYRDRLDLVFNNTSIMFENIKKDSDGTTFKDSLNKMIKDMVMDEHGNPDLYVLQDSLGQMRKMILPLFREQLKSIPLPKVEYSDDKLDFALENLMFRGDDILPDNIFLKMKNELGLNTDKMLKQTDNQIVLKINNVRTRLENIKFFYNRKSFPKISDHGIADVYLEGKGFSMKVKWNIFKSNKGFKIQSNVVVADIDKLTIKIREADDHKIIDKLIAKVLQGRIKKQVIQGVQDSVLKNMLVLEEKINGFLENRLYFNTMERANSAMKRTYVRHQNKPPLKERILNKAQGLTSGGTTSHQNYPEGEY